MKNLVAGEFDKQSLKATFFGMDWGRKDRSGLVCPGCFTVHQWRLREPKNCRQCGVKFLFTASIAVNQQPTGK